MVGNYSRTEKRVGLFVVSIVVLLLATVVILGRGKDWFAEEVTFYTSFKESYNLEVNAAVKLFKADIGKVKRISIGEDNVNVQMAILSKYASRIRLDSVALVDSPTLIGSEYISILPGSTKAPKIPPGGMIPSMEKKSISDLIKEFEVEKTALLTVRMIQEMAQLVSLMTDPEGPLLTTMTNVEKTANHLVQITGRIEQGEGLLGSLVASRALMDGVLQNIEKMNAVLDDVRVVSARGPLIMDQVSDNLATIQSAGTGVASGVQSLQTILEEARQSLSTIQAILENLKKGSQDVPRVTETAKAGIREIREGVENIDRVVQSLQRNFIIRSNLSEGPASAVSDVGIRP